MRNIPLMRAYGDAASLYNVNITEDEFIEIALIAWNKIGNKPYKLTDYVVSNPGESILIPDACDEIEAIYREKIQYASSLNVSDRESENQRYEAYNFYRKPNDRPNHVLGELLSNYTIEYDTIRFACNVDYPVCVLIKTYITDDEGLPFINNKELNAIALYVAYIYYQKKALMSRNQADLNFAAMFKTDWMKALTIAKQPEYMSQNDLNDILDSTRSSNRKQYGKSYNF